MGFPQRGPVHLSTNPLSLTPLLMEGAADSSGAAVLPSKRKSIFLAHTHSLPLTINPGLGYSASLPQATKTKTADFSEP